MNGGRVQQIGDPKRIYDEPKNAFVADFIGESNILDGVMLEDDLVKFSGTEFQCVDEGFGTNAPVDVVVRPEDIMIVGEDVGMLAGTVESVIFKGVHYEMMIRGEGAGENILWKVHSTTMQPVGTRVGMTIVPYNIHIMRKATTADAAPVAQAAEEEA
ncbi:MAG: TOBE domain-containing protein, partial [Clostridia bacterium]|nr:TOBE domain-containing protein [Clostridia bacterium]